jgi:subtilisin family serine protease
MERMEGDSVRLKVATALTLALLVGTSLVGSPTAAGSSVGATPLAATSPRDTTKFPWRSDAARTIPGRIVVVWRDGVSRAHTRALAATVGAVAGPATQNVQVVRVAPGRTAAAIRRYKRSPLVRFAEPDRLLSPLAPPNDPLFDQQWGLDNTGQSHKITQYKGLSGANGHGTADADVDAPEAWAAQAVNDPVVVAVIDTGVETTHPDLQNSLWVNAGETPANDVDDDGNGFTDDINGWDFFDRDANPRPANGINNSHGSHVAGVIGAERDNATGISGVCGDCQIMALRVGSASHLTLSREIKAIDYAADNGADVINLSLGSAVWSDAERDAIRKAGNKGVLVVVAAGNASLDNDIDFYDPDSGSAAPSFPASYTLDNILSVAASNDRDQYAYVSQCRGVLPLWRCGFTSYGHDSVDVAAPGTDILSTVKAGISATAYDGYDVWDGTSMATPMVAGIAGLVLAENPTYSPIDVKNAIMNSVDEPNSLKLYTSWGKVTGVGTKALSGRFTRTQGRVNALGALTGATTNATPHTDGNIDGARSIDRRREDRMSWPSDVNDVYKKRLVDGRRYRVTVDGPAGSDFDLWVWKPGTQEIFQFVSDCFQTSGCPPLAAVSATTKSDESVAFTAHRTGTFYFQVNDWYTSGRYVLRVKKI